MAITTLTTDLDIIAALDDEPNDVSGMTAAEAKAKFDEGPNDIKDYINGTMIPELDAVHLPYDYTVTGGQTIKEAVEELTAGVMPDGSVTEAKLTDEVAAKLNLSQKNLLNILQLKLQMALSASDIDAWSDLLADGTAIDAANSQNVMLDGGAFKLLSISQSSGSGYYETGYSAALEKRAQTFTLLAGTIVTGVTISVRKVGTPTDNITVGIYATSGGVPTTLIASTSTTLYGGTITTSPVDYTFNFDNVTLTGGTMYAIVVGRSGANSSTNYYSITYSSGGYSGGTLCTYDSSTTSWTSSTYDMKFSISVSGSSYAVWNAVTATEALTYAAVTADQTEGTGTITWYLSDDGTHWTEVSSLDAIQSVGFVATSVYLKCILTGDATVEAVAWGGYKNDIAKEKDIGA